MSATRRLPEAAWTLSEALERALPFSDAQELRQLKSGLRGADQEVMFGRLQSALSEARTLDGAGDEQAAVAAWDRYRAIERLLEASREHFHDTHDALDAIRASFRSMMAAGRLLGFGKSETGNGEFQQIPAEAWRSAGIDWDRSALSYGRRDDRVHMVSVRVRPLLHIPGAPELGSSRSLRAVFQSYVLADPELVAILDRANGCFPGGFSYMCSEVSRGMFTDVERRWPAALEEYDLAVEWMTAFQDSLPGRTPMERQDILDRLMKGSQEDRAAFAVIRRAEAVVIDRVGRLLDPLRTGEIIASGVEDDYLGQSFIPREFWSRSTIRIDFLNSEMWEVIDGPPKRLWHGLVLSRPETSPAPSEGAQLSEEELKPKGGRPPKHDWESAFARLMIKLLNGLEPKSGAELAERLLDCFQEMKASAVPSRDQAVSWLKKHQNLIYVRYRKADGE